MLHIVQYRFEHNLHKQCSFLMLVIAEMNRVIVLDKIIDLRLIGVPKRVFEKYSKNNT